MINKNELAKNITGIEEEIVRIIGSNYELDFKEGEIYDNLGKAESWSAFGNFTIENDYEYYYVLKANNVPVHHIDYTNEEITHALGATDCEEEKEVLVAADTKLVITSEPYYPDFEEMGYFVVYLEVAEEE